MARLPEPAPSRTGAGGEPRLLEQLALSALLVSATAAFARAHGQAAAWAALAPVALGLAWRPRAAPRALLVSLPLAARALAGATVLFGAIWTLYPVIPQALVEAGPVALGYLLLAVACALLLGSRVWAPGGGLVPASLALLVDASLEPGARIGAAVASAAASALLWLLLSTRPVEGAGAFLRRTLRAAVPVGAAAAIAVGIVRLLPWAQPQVESAIGKVLTPQSAGYAGLGPTSALGDIEQLSLSPRVVLRLWAPRPQRLRARVLTRFDGRVWHPGAADDVPLAPGPALPPDLARWLATIPGTDFARAGSLPRLASVDLVRSTIVQATFNDGQLLAPPGLLLLRADIPRPELDSFGTFRPVHAQVEVYGVVNDPARVDEGPCPGCLDVAGDTDPRLGALAASLALGAEGPAERVARTAAHLDRECRYSLKVGRFHSRQPVAEFLFEKKRGYCEYFASAAAILLRLQGVPTRYVAGFNVTDSGRRGDHYVVREADAHAWIEALLPGRGWVEVDPTPAAQYEEAHAGLRGGWWEAIVEPVRAFLDALWTRLQAGDWRALASWTWTGLRGGAGGSLAALVAVAAAVLLVRHLRGRLRWGHGRAAPPAPDGVSPALAFLLARVDAGCRRRGHPRPAARAPLEHLALLPPGAAPEPWLRAARQAVACFYSARYGGAVVPPAEVRSLAEDLTREEGGR